MTTRPLIKGRCPKCGDVSIGSHCDYKGCPWLVCTKHTFDNKGRYYDRKR